MIKVWLSHYHMQRPHQGRTVATTCSPPTYRRSASARYGAWRSSVASSGSMPWGGVATANGHRGMRIEKVIQYGETSRDGVFPRTIVGLAMSRRQTGHRLLEIQQVATWSNLCWNTSAYISAHLRYYACMAIDPAACKCAICQTHTNLHRTGVHSGRDWATRGRSCRLPIS